MLIVLVVFLKYYRCQRCSSDLYVGIRGNKNTNILLKTYFIASMYNIQLIPELIYTNIYMITIELLQCHVIGSKLSRYLDLSNNNEQLRLTF